MSDGPMLEKMSNLLDVVAVQVGETNVVVTRLAQNLIGLRDDVAILKGDVAILKGDVAILKSDVSDLKIGFVRMERQLGRVETRVEAIEEAKRN